MVVTESYLDRFVLNGGWSMCLLLPFSVMAFAFSVRCVLALRSDNINYAAGQLHQRIQQSSDTSKEYARDESYRAALQLYTLLQPLWTIFTLSPLVGLAGSITTLMVLFSGRLTDPGNVAILHHAMIPPLWGVSISVVSYTVAALCRGRIYDIETEVFLPAATAANQNPSRPVVP